MAGRNKALIRPYCLFSPLFGEVIQFDEYFSDGLKPPTSNPWVQKNKACGSLVGKDDVQCFGSHGGFVGNPRQSGHRLMGLR